MHDLNELRQRLQTQRPVPWDQLPDFALYMDQVLSYMDRQVIRFGEDDALTAAMVNNYTKSGLVPRAEGKKYSREHLAYLTAICVLKRVLSAKDIDLLLREELRDDRQVEEGYAAFCASLDNALNLTADEMADRTGEDSLADSAIHFALLSYAAGVASSRYVAALRERQEAEHPGKVKKGKERDRNHPCVVLWSLGNELQHHADMPFNDWGVTLYRLMRQLLHRYDHTRLTTVAMHPRYRNIDTDSLPADLAVATEVNSYNYRYMYFPGDMKRYPEKIFYQSEASTEAMGPNFFEMNLDKVMGLAYWGAVDYLGESLGWPLKGWNKGVFDMTMLPKPDAYFVKSMFSEEPLVHIAIIEKAGTDTQWNGINVATQRLSENWNRNQGEQLSLYTYTNVDEVELLLNGRSLGVKKNDADPKLRNRIRWDAVPYEPGTLMAVARKAGKVVARHQLTTTGEAVALRLEPESRCWQADGKDLQFVRVTATDRKGRRVLSAHQLLQIELKGEADIVAVGNGDMASSELPVGDKQLASHASRSLYEGAACIVLRSRRQAGKVELKVKSGNLSAGSLRMNTQ